MIFNQIATWTAFVILAMFQLSDHIEYIRVGGRRQRGTRTRTRTTSRKVGFITLVGVRMVDAIIFFIYSIFNIQIFKYSNIQYSIFDLRSYVLMIEDTVDGKDI